MYPSKLPQNPSVIKVKSSHAASPKKPPKDTEQLEICLCRSLKPVLRTINIFGLLPIKCTNDDGHCVYGLSYIWLAHSILLGVLYLIHLFVFTDVLNFNRSKPLPELLAALNDTAYLLFVIALTTLNIARFPNFVKALNKLVKVTRDAELVCNSAYITLRNVNFGYVSVLVLLLLVEYSVLTWLHASNTHQTDFDHRIIFNMGVGNVPFIFYMLFMTICSTFMSILGCFERLCINALKFKPVHPLNEIDETNNKKNFLGIIEYELCKGDHRRTSKMSELSEPELVEYLRSLHEDISLSMFEFNVCLNPQLLFYTVVELTVLIIYWYEVIIYTSYTFSTPFASTINILSWMFVISHSLGLFLFLKSAQDLKNMVHGLTNILLEYSTRISTTEEHQQVRLFIEKLKLHRPITASGVFTIDLGIAAPISANILTYVLVALQFDIPKN